MTGIGAIDAGGSFPQTPAQESPEGTAGLADCNDCVLRSKPKPSTKVAVGIVPSENAELLRLRDWKVDRGDIRADPNVAREILEFIEEHGVLSVAMTDAIIGCPHQEGIDYQGEWCPICEFWHGRDRLRGRQSISFSAKEARDKSFADDAVIKYSLDFAAMHSVVLGP